MGVKQKGCPYCAKPGRLGIATGCIECNRRFFAGADVEMLRVRSRWLSQYHPENVQEIRNEWKRLYRSATATHATGPAIPQKASTSSSQACASGNASRAATGCGMTEVINHRE